MGSIEDREERIDEILAASFPASDPPPWTTGVETPGLPRRPLRDTDPDPAKPRPE